MGPVEPVLPFFLCSWSVRTRLTRSGARDSAVQASSGHRHVNHTRARPQSSATAGRTAVRRLGVGVGQEGEPGQAEDVGAVLAAAAAAALVARLDVTQDLQVRGQSLAPRTDLAACCGLDPRLTRTCSDPEASVLVRTLLLPHSNLNPDF